MSEKHTVAKSRGGSRVRVLVDGHYGKVNTVVTLEDDALTEAVASGQVDPDPRAVAAAES